MPDDFDLKDFMESEQIPSWPSHHDRIQEVFASVGFLVFYVERGCLNPVWTVCVNDMNGWARSAEVRRAIHRLLADSNINVDVEPVTIVPEGVKTRIIFAHDAGETAKRITYLRSTRHGLSACREVFTLVEPF